MKNRIVRDIVFVLVGAVITLIIMLAILSKDNIKDGNDDSSDGEVIDLVIEDGNGENSLDTGAAVGITTPADGSELTREECDIFANWLLTEYNYGFALSDYDDVRYCNYDQVTYNLDEGYQELGITEQQIAEEMVNVYGGEPTTDVTCYTFDALDKYVQKYAGISAKDIPTLAEPDSEKYGLYMREHGDTNAFLLNVTKGTHKSDGTFEVTVSSEDGDVSVMTFRHTDGGFQVVSNKLLTCLTYEYNQQTKLVPEDFIFPHSECSYISPSSLEGMTAKDCKIARNEIYARYGRIFNDKELSEYFSQFGWYNPRYTEEVINHDSLTRVEKINLRTIKEYEEKMGYR